jgi:hypothetical protein
MKIDLLILQIAILFLPGIIWARLDVRYSLNSKPSDTEFIIRAFVFGLATYAVTFLLYSAVGWQFTIVDFEDAGSKAIVNRAIVGEILCALAVGVALSILWIYAATYKILTNFLQIIGATKTYGDEDVWDFTFNSRSAAVEYIHFRDLENKVVYAGWVNTFSESEKLREIVLRDVQVFDEASKLLYETPMLYLARKPEGTHIEFPYVAEDAKR